jgi:hypothetical protein
MLARNRDAILKEWLARTLQTYPFLSSRFLLEEKDQFRNPVGHALREGLPVLIDEILGEMDMAKIESVLSEIMKARAVQDFTASEAVSFILGLRVILRQSAPDADISAYEDRIDRMALLAFDLYMQCRERTYEIKANEAKRTVYVLERMKNVHVPRAANGEAAIVSGDRA